jgi:hypothetical protein
LSATARPSYDDALRGVIGKRRAGVAPNYEETHKCHDPNIGCGREYLCPDRYTEPACVVKYRRQLCSPCAGHFDVERRALWYEAHGIGGGQAV